MLKFFFDYSTLVCGIIRSNRKGFFDFVKKAKLKKGEVNVYRSSEFFVMKFKDKRDVLMLIIIYNEEMVLGRRFVVYYKLRWIVEWAEWIVLIS